MSQRPILNANGDRCCWIDTLDRHAELPRIERLACERRGAAYRQRPADYGPDYVFVQWTLSGCGAVWTDAAPHRFLPIPVGACLVLRTQRPGLAYGSRPDTHEPWTFAYANIHGAAARGIAAAIDARFGPVAPFPGGAVADEALALITRTPHRGQVALSAGESLRLAVALLSLPLSAIGDAPGGALVARACAWMRGSATRPSVAATAQACGVTREHLTRAFRRHLGEPPARWWRRQRRLDGWRGDG